MPRRRRRPRDPLRFMSQQELEMQADRLLEAGLARPRSQNKRAREEARRQEREDATAIQGFATALANVIGSTRLGQETQAAAGRQGVLSRGYADAQQTAEQAAAAKANALLSEQGIGGGVTAGPLSQVTGYLGGMGASNLGVEGDALRNYARGVQGSVAGRAQQQLLARMSEGQKEQAKFRDQLEDLMSQTPAKRMEILNSLYSRELQKRAAATQEAYLGLAGRKQSFEEQFSYDKLASDAAADAAKDKGKGNKAKIAARKARLDALGKNKEKAFTFAEDLAQKYTDPLNPMQGIKPNSWAPAYAAVWRRYGTGLMRYAPPHQKKWWRGQIEAMLVNALKTAGFTKTRGTNRG